MFLKTKLLTQTSCVLTLILLPASRGSVICRDSNLGVTRVLFADRLTPSRRSSRTQTAPVQKPLCTHWTQAKERSKRLSFLAHVWSCLDVPTLCLDQSWSTSPQLCPLWKHIFVDKRCSETVSRLSKGWGFRPLSELTSHWESTKFHFLSYLGVSKCIYPRLCQYLLTVRLNIPWFAPEDGKRFSFALRILLCSCPCL